MSWPDHRALRWTPTARVASGDGTPIAVEILGAGHPGPTVVFTHGWTLSSRSWHYQRMLAERYRLVLVDHRAHGESGLGARSSRTIEQIGRDLHSVIEQTCTGRDVVLVGHSMGGMTIMALAAEHPELFGSVVKGVALIDTSAGRRPDDTLGLRGPLAKVAQARFESTLALMRTDPRKAERLRRSGSRVSIALSRFLNFGVKPDRRLSMFAEAMSAATPAEVVGDFWSSLESHDHAAALPTLGRVPTLVVVGERDRLTPPAHARTIAAAVPGARLLELRGAGHSPMLEQPGEVNAALRVLIAEAEAHSQTGAGVAPSPVEQSARVHEEVAS